MSLQKGLALRSSDIRSKTWTRRFCAEGSHGVRESHAFLVLKDRTSCWTLIYWIPDHTSGTDLGAETRVQRPECPVLTLGGTEVCLKWDLDLGTALVTGFPFSGGIGRIFGLDDAIFQIRIYVSTVDVLVQSMPLLVLPKSTSLFP